MRSHPIPLDRPKTKTGSRPALSAVPPPLPSHRPPSGWSTRQIAVAVTVLLLVNGVGYRLYRAWTRQAPAPVEKTLEAEEPQQPDHLAIGRAHRVAGLAALEEGDYTRAVKELTQAAKLGSGTSDVPALLKIAKDLEERKTKGPTLAAPAPAPSPAPVAKASPPPPKRRESRESRESRPKPKEEEPESRGPGVLLVTSAPSGVLIELDGQAVDLTPARLSVSPGAHSVALVRGDERLYERRVSVSAGSVVSVDADVAGELAKRQAAIAAQVAHASLDAPAPIPERPAPAVPIPSGHAPRGSGGAVGEIYVVSPEVIGEAYINGKRYGVPPLLAKEVPAGRAVVEIRVGGVARRQKTVEVPANQRVTARMR